jgi:phosphatidate cytidylyltransferase
MTVAPVTGAPVAAGGGRRVLIGIGLAVLGLGLVLWPPGFALLVTAIAVGCLWEFAQLSKANGPAIAFPVALVAVIAYMALTYFQQIHRYEGVLLGATVVIALGTAALNGASGSLARSGFTVLGVLYIGKLLSYFIAIRALPSIGAAAVTWAIVMIAFTDIFAMVVGTTLGKTPLSPLSPKKTVEGSIGGLAFAVVAGIGGGLTPWFHLPWWEGAIIGLIVSVAAQAGDLVESALKRDARVKDAGSLIAGHGGVLDRFDSYTFGGIAFYFALYILHVIPSRSGV